MVKNLFILILLFYSAISYAQGGNNNPSVGKALDNNFNQGYTSAAVASYLSGDSVFSFNGNLLFYRNIDSTSDVNGRFVPQGLLPHGAPDAKGVFIVPDIKDINKHKKEENPTPESKIK